METLLELIEKAIVAILVDIHQKTGSSDFKKGLEQYLAILKPSIAKYEHHQGNDISDEELQKRYEYETALLHLLTNILTFNLQEKSVTWPIYEQGSPYKWYQIPSSLLATITNIFEELSKLDSPALVISQISGQILDKVSKRYWLMSSTSANVQTQLENVGAVTLTPAPLPGGEGKSCSLSLWERVGVRDRLRLHLF